MTFGLGETLGQRRQFSPNYDNFSNEYVSQGCGLESREFFYLKDHYNSFNLHTISNLKCVKVLSCAYMYDKRCGQDFFKVAIIQKV